MFSDFISTVVGSGNNLSEGNGGAATSAGLSEPRGFWATPDGTLYIVESGVANIRVVEKNTQIITHFAGSGDFSYNGEGIPATSANLNTPIGIWGDTVGHVFVCDRDNNRIRQIVVSTTLISSVVGNGYQLYSGNSGPATSASIRKPTNLWGKCV